MSSTQCHRARYVQCASRIRAGLERRRAEGKPVGRQRGAADKKLRKRSGYVAAW